MEGAAFEIKLPKNSKCTQKAWDKFSKPAVKVAAPFIGNTVAAKDENPQVEQATTKNLKSL